MRNSRIYCEVPSDINNNNWDIANENSGYAVIQPNTEYYISCICTKNYMNNTYVAKISNDGENWTNIWSLSSTKTVHQPNQLQVGIDRSIDLPFLGKIYMQDCYIENNNNLVWQGVI